MIDDEIFTCQDLHDIFSGIDVELYGESRFLPFPTQAEYLKYIKNMNKTNDLAIFEGDQVYLSNLSLTPNIRKRINTFPKLTICCKTCGKCDTDRIKGMYHVNLCKGVKKPNHGCKLCRFTGYNARIVKNHIKREHFSQYVKLSPQDLMYCLRET